MAERAPLTRLDFAATAGALLGLALMAGAAWRFLPVRGFFENVANGGEVARILAEARPPGGPGAFDAVREDLDARWRGYEGLLAPGRREALGLAERLAALRAWSDLKIDWARALAANGLTAEQYRAEAAQRGLRPYDPLLLGIR